MMDAIEKVAKEFAAAVMDLIEWAWHKVVAPQG